MTMSADQYHIQFQFQDGAIISIKDSIKKLASNQFQFQDDAIIR